MGKFLGKYSLPGLNQEEIRNTSRQIISTKIETMILKIPNKGKFCFQNHTFGVPPKPAPQFSWAFLLTGPVPSTFPDPLAQSPHPRHLQSPQAEKWHLRSAGPPPVVL